MTTTTASPTTPLIGTWAVDPDHTTVEFRVKHVGLARVRGVFRRLDGAITFGDNGEISGSGTIDAASLDPRVASRDATCAPSTSSTSTTTRRSRSRRHRWRGSTKKACAIVGDLTIRGVTQSVELTGDILGFGLDDDGMSRTGLDVAGVLDRRDFGLTWNKAVDGGGLLVGNRVDVRLEVSAVRRP